MPAPRYTDIIAALPSTAPFIGADTHERARGKPFAARLGANESAFGPSPKVIEAIRAAAPDIWMYGDAESHDLRLALAAQHGVAKENIVIGEGIDGLLGTLVRLVVAPGDPVVSSLGAYPTFAYHVRGVGAHLTEVPYRGDHEDPEALAEAARRTGAKLVYLANPDNPMGSWHPAARIQALFDILPKDTLLVLDEAYGDLAPTEALPPVDATNPRVIRFRTFSKAYGLAGMRVGYGIAHGDLVATFDKLRNHFGVGRLSQVAALAALEDREWLDRTVAQIIRARDRLSAIARDNGLTPLPSATNFVTMDCGGDGARARAILGALADRGVFIRMPFVAPQDRCIRVSAGPDPDLDIFADALRRVLADLPSRR